MTDMILVSQVENTDLKSEVERLRAVNKIALMLGTTLDFEAFVNNSSNPSLIMSVVSG